MLETRRLILRNFKIEDAHDVYEYAKVEGIGERAGWIHHKSIEESKQIIEKFFLKSANCFAIVDKKTNKVIGSIDLKSSFTLKQFEKEGTNFEIGYVLSKDYHGQGLMTEACLCLIKYGFEELKADHIFCCHSDKNLQSQRVIEKCGFVFLNKEMKQNSLFNDDRLLLGYEITKEDYWNQQLYKRIIERSISESQPIIEDAVKKMFDNPEIGNQEFYAHELLTDILKQKGFEVTSNFVLETGFKAEYRSDRKGPRIAILAEYDALPGIGHGCGHNLIAGISLLTGIALRNIINNVGGTLLVIGTPAEENFGGKVEMVQNGVFASVDAALMIHPSSYNGIGGRTNALNPVKFEFFGKTAHGCKPYEGKSALDAAVLTYQSINMMRQFSKPNTFIHGIIRDGGKACNIIPDYASLEYYFRSDKMSYAQELTDKAIKACEGACLATGTSFKHHIFECPYEDFKVNYRLANILKEKFNEIGINDVRDINERPEGSSDIGAVSYCCPALHGYIKICNDDILAHSVEFACQTISEIGKTALKNASTALSLVALELFTNEEELLEIKKEFNMS